MYTGLTILKFKFKNGKYIKNKINQRLQIKLNLNRRIIIFNAYITKFEHKVEYLQFYNKPY